jgi:pimeloyl-ACP methyl ester carboxylesterase
MALMSESSRPFVAGPWDLHGGVSVTEEQNIDPAGPNKAMVKDSIEICSAERTRFAAARIDRRVPRIAEFMHATGLERPLVVGHSLGGAISLAMALHYPECVSAFAPIGP